MSRRVMLKTQLNHVWGSQQECSLPEGARLVFSHKQHGRAMLWFEADPDQPVTIVGQARMVQTGVPIELLEGEFYFGTILLQDETLVAHIFWQPTRRMN